MKTIEAAVIELGGKLPNPTCRKTSNAAKLERENVIDAAVKIYDDKKCFSAESFAVELHKAGMLVLPPKKSDTED